jgi:hypothetical protein
LNLRLLPRYRSIKDSQFETVFPVEIMIIITDVNRTQELACVQVSGLLQGKRGCDYRNIFTKLRVCIVGRFLHRRRTAYQGAG